MQDYKVRTTKVTILPVSEPLFSEMATTVEIVDEAAGEFVEVSQQIGKIAISPEEWPYLRGAIDAMIETCNGVPNESPV